MSMLLSTKYLAFIQSFSKCLYTKQAKINSPTIKLFATKQTPKHESNNSSSIPVQTQTFQENLTNRKEQASRSILVQVQSAQSYKELHSYCSSFGTVKNMLHYSTGVEPMHFIIVEFNNEDGVQNAFAGSSYQDDTHAVPVQSQFMWFRAARKKLTKANNLKMDLNGKLLVENGNSVLRDLEIQEILRNSNSVSEQMQQLHNLTKLNEVGTRLRFLVAKQVELAVAGMFPSAIAFPFGSSVNGYGKMGCDLDLVLKLNNNLPSINEDSRLVFHSKASVGSERSTSQRHMEAISDILQLFLPGCAQVRRILQARVPIIKYYQQLADIECDLSMSNTSGVHMSDFLYLMGSIDDRVRPLVFTIRRWAAETGLTNSSPGRWISNFSLTLLVIAFLQSNFVEILPSLNRLVQLAGENDKFTAEDGLNVTFLRDHKKYLELHPTTNTDDLKTLLQKFFEFYSSFDFQSKAISLNEGTAITKPEHSALYIVNPLERGLNVSKNVSIEELEKFKMELRNAAWLLEADENRTTNWGLLHICTPKKKIPKLTPTPYTKHTKLLQVSQLFEEDIDYKNEDIKRQVHSIKQTTKEHIKNLASSLDINSQKSGR